MSCYSKAIESLFEYRELSGAVDQKRLPMGVLGLSHIHKAHFIHALCEEKKKKVRQILSHDLTDEEYQNCGQTIVDCIHLSASKGKQGKEQFYHLMLSRFGKKVGGGLYKKVRDDYPILAQCCELSSINI